MLLSITHGIMRGLDSPAVLQKTITFGTLFFKAAHFSKC